ncbi:uncharacterized protein F58A4.6 [Chelonus insularis]|uniref:uncharacterized protein F58A4.6 n=1 Tax=Chelonus insularis TaxID=460826 RepID=UPI00158DA9BC|nr:uncharacterized protein F58A4.6 [Chelonus insularis]
MDIRLVIHHRKSIYDDLIVNHEYVADFKTINKYKMIDNGNKDQVDINKKFKLKITPVFINKRGFNGYLASAYVFLLKTSDVYRQSAIKLLKYLILSRMENDVGRDSDAFVIFINLIMPKKQFLDYKWNRIITVLALERRELNYAMSWLSTLGGAFSAMGEQFDSCAKVAGKISMHQFKLALRLNDPLLIARCRLYACLSLIQQNKLKLPRTEIPRIYEFAKLNEDKQLKRMCQGVWAKFKYSYYLEKKKKKNKK